MKPDLQDEQRYTIKTDSTSCEIIIPNREGRAIIWIPLLMFFGWAIGGYKLIDFIYSYFGSIILGVKNGRTIFSWGATIFGSTQTKMNPLSLLILSMILLALLIIWSIIGKFLFEEIMWRIVGEEILEITQENITMSHSYLRFSRKRIYSAKDIQDFSVFDEGFMYENSRSKIAAYRGLKGGLISVEYENGNIIKIGNLLKMDDAQEIVNRLSKVFQFTK